MSRGQENLIFN